ncbi:MAG: hypothetical protein R3E86_05510 [Pseudomonadales bacterium]
MLYVLLDTNVTAGYYLPRSLNSSKARSRIENIFDSARSGESEMFFYIPNFCVAETFSVFMKHSFGKWNTHVKKKGTIDTRIYNQLVAQFQSDIHNGHFLYHYELSRYHVLGINLVAPVDHYYKFKRGKKYVAPMGTFDHLIVSMGIHLAYIHGKDNVVLLTADDRISNILDRCNAGLPASTIRKLKLQNAEQLTGKPFHPDTFPQCVNLKSAKIKDLAAIFGSWPLPVGRIAEPPYRYKRI